MAVRRKKSPKPLREMDVPMVLGYELDRATLTPIHRPIVRTPGKDYGSDPVGDGTFRMVPSGDIVDYEERNRRLGKSNPSPGRKSARGPYDVEPSYRMRFIKPEQAAELSNLYHLARTPLGTAASKHARMIWASDQFAKAHPEVSPTAAYKDLDGILSQWFGNPSPGRMSQFLLTLYDLGDEGALWPSGTMWFPALSAARSYGDKVISEKGATHYVVTDGKSQRPKAFYGFKTSGEAERYGLTSNPSPGRKSAGEQKMTFEKLYEPFKAWLSEVASEHGKSVEQVFGWWREYTQECRNYDQSPVQSEFLDWYRDKLLASGTENPSPGRKSACGSAGGRDNPTRLMPHVKTRLIWDVSHEMKDFSSVPTEQDVRRIVDGYNGAGFYDSLAKSDQNSLVDGALRAFRLWKWSVEPWTMEEENPSSGIKFVYGILGKGAKRVSEVQSVLLDKARYTVAQAKKWLEDHGFKYGSVDEGGSKAGYLRFRQQDPKRYHTMRTGEAGRKNPLDWGATADKAPSKSSGTTAFLIRRLDYKGGGWNWGGISWNGPSVDYRMNLYRSHGFEIRKLKPEEKLSDEQIEERLTGYETFPGLGTGEAGAKGNPEMDNGIENEYEEPQEPEEGDLITEDHHHFYQDGKLVVVVPPEHDWENKVCRYMDEENFWPNVWFLSDHGNYHPLTFTTVQSRGNPILGMGALPPHALIQHPNGVWSFVGRVDARLSYLRKDGSEPTEEELRKAGQFGPGLMGLKTRVWATQEEAEQAAAELGIKVGQVSPHRQGNPNGGPEIPPVITHKNMEPLLEALQHEPEFMIGMPPVSRGPKWYRRKVTLEFPLGELAKGGLQSMALVGRLEHRTMPITGKEQFSAQGLEGKVQVEKDLFSALMNLRDLLPEYRGRIITRPMEQVKNPEGPASASVVVHTREGAAHSYGDQSHFSEAVNEAIRWTKDGGGPYWVRLYEYYPGGSILKQTRVEDGKAAVEKNPKGNPETITPVIFRKFKEDPTELVAVFPASLGTLEGDVDYYVSAGGHSAAPLQGLMSKTTPANPKEYARIKDELERSYDYRLRVVERDSPAFRAGRRKQLREYRQGNPESESDQARIEAKSNWLGTLRSTRNNRLVAVMSTIPGGIYLHWINYEGLFPAGATMSYTRADLNKRLADGTYVWVKKAPGVAENPNGASESESAAALYEQFHGRPSSETLEYHEEIEVPDELAGLGDLTEIKVATMSGLDVTLSFEDDPPKLCSTPDGKQLHIIGGDASLPLDKLKMDGDKWLRDSMVIGVLYELTYRTQKDFHRFSPTNYFHKFADPKEKRSDVEPMLIYDSVNKQLSVSGGQYEISKPGIQG